MSGSTFRSSSTAPTTAFMPRCGSSRSCIWVSGCTFCSGGGPRRMPHISTSSASCLSPCTPCYTRAGSMGWTVRCTGATSWPEQYSRLCFCTSHLSSADVCGGPGLSLFTCRVPCLWDCRFMPLRAGKRLNCWRIVWTRPRWPTWMLSTCWRQSCSLWAIGRRDATRAPCCAASSSNGSHAAVY